MDRIYFEIGSRLRRNDTIGALNSYMRSQSIVKSLSVKEDFSPLLRLAIPLVLTGIMQSSMNFFENIFLARLGSEILAAGALVAWFFATLIVIIFGIFGSVNVLVSHKHGAKDIAGISQVLRDGLALAILLVIPTFLLVWNMAPFFLLVGQNAKLVALATSYLHPLAWGLLPKFILIVLFEMLLGIGHTRLITVFTMLTIPIYIFFSWALIFGKLGFPVLGIAGAGWGMTIGDWLSTAFLCLYVFTCKEYRCYFSSLITFKTNSYLWEILHIGVPMGVMYSVEVGFFFVMTLLMGLLGAQSLAANQVTMQYLGPLMGIIFCIAQSMTIRMGHQLGANEVSSAERACYAGIILSALVMCVVAVIYWLFPTVLISVDFDVHAIKNADTVRFAKEFLFIAAFFQMFEAVRIALFGALRGLKDTRFTLMISIISFWFIALPVGYVLSTFLKLGGIGFWWGMLMGVSFSVVLLYKRFKFKINAYKKVEVLN